MMRHDEALLWEYAARELPSEDARLVQHHLTECPDCQEKLTDVRTARGALAAAKGQDFSFTWAKPDAAIARAVERGAARPLLGRPWVMSLSGALVAAGLALVAYGVWTKPAPSTPSPELAGVVAPAIPASTSPSVEKASGLTVIGAQTRALSGGAALASGDVLRTDAKGEGTLRLPEGTRLKLSPSSQLSLTRAATDDITLSLDRGHVAVAASHAKRKGFVVHAQGLMVTVVGTTFAVTSGRDGVEIAVGDGRVSVEPPSGLPMFVNAGQKVRFDARWRSTRTSLSKADKKELAAIAEAEAAAPPPPPPPMPAPEPVRQEPVVARASAVVPATGGGSDLRSLAGDSIDELAPLPQPVRAAPAPAPAAQPEPLQVAAAPPPPPSKPDMTGLSVPLLALPLEAVKKPAPAAPGFAEWPAEKKAEPANPNASKLSGEELPEDMEAIFMTKADRALAKGGCERFMVGLEEIAMDPKHGPRAEKARIMRARCFDMQMKTKETENEYRRYVRDYPNGVFLEEARAVMGGN